MLVNYHFWKDTVNASIDNYIEYIKDNGIYQPNEIDLIIPSNDSILLQTKLTNLSSITISDFNKIVQNKESIVFYFCHYVEYYDMFENKFNTVTIIAYLLDNDINDGFVIFSKEYRFMTEQYRIDTMLELVE